VRRRIRPLSPQARITVTGANHYSIANKDNPTREPDRPTLNHSTAPSTIARWSGLFLHAAMLNDRLFTAIEPHRPVNSKQDLSKQTICLLFTE
jgi:hypothetical protein